MTAKAAPPSELDRIVAQVSHEISAGRLVCKVKAIREHLGCGQGKASEVRRRLVAVGAAGTHI